MKVGNKTGTVYLLDSEAEEVKQLRGDLSAAAREIVQEAVFGYSLES